MNYLNQGNAREQSDKSEGEEGETSMKLFKRPASNGDPHELLLPKTSKAEFFSLELVLASFMMNPHVIE